MFNNLIEFIRTMPTEQKCREFIAEQRWGKDRVVCPYCQHEKAYVIEGGKRFKCASKACYKKFSVTVGTIMEASNIPLIKWLTGIYLVSAHKKGISSYQLGKDLGIAQKNSWFMLHRIREMLRVKENVKLDNIVEVDEVYMGGKVKNMSKTKRAIAREQGTNSHKTMVMGMVERGGNLKLIPVGNAATTTIVYPTIRENIDKDAVLITDSFGAYTGVGQEYAGHEVVNHSEQEYVRDSVFHTNTIEGAFSLFKRSIYGIYHQCSAKHLARYCDETMFRYNFRKAKDADRFRYSLTLVEGRLTWKALVNAPAEQKILIDERNVPAPTKTSGTKSGRPVYQILDGKIIAHFNTIRDAEKETGVKQAAISKVLRGKRITSGGYQWKYA